MKIRSDTRERWSNQQGNSPGSGALKSKSHFGKEQDPIEAKIVLIGDMAVGKSSLAGRFNKGDFIDS